MRCASRRTASTIRRPNPAVGCVLVNDGRVVGTGWTAPAGGPHAERVALTAAGAAARGATAYVTLEPCCHTGRTGPCTQGARSRPACAVSCSRGTIRIRASTAAARKELAAAGIAVEGGVMERAAEPLNRGFFTRMRRGLPYVRSKLAVSLDGRTALANGASQWITGAAARADVHRWRARSSAVLTGSGTIVDDDPSLDARRERSGHRRVRSASSSRCASSSMRGSRRRRRRRRCRCRARCSC